MTKCKKNKKTDSYAIPINWDKVDEFLLAGCIGTEIAGFLGIHEDTLYRATAREHNMTFAAYRASKRAKGDSILRAHQFAKALGLTDKGDNTLLIWLGKTRLGQREMRDQDDISLTIAEVLEHLKNGNISQKDLENLNESEMETKQSLSDYRQE